MTWDDADRTEEDIFFDEIEEKAQQLGIIIGTSREFQRIVGILEDEADELLSHDDEYDCKIRGEEILRLIKKIYEAR